ncbi:MAG: sugar transferase, partial [Desulfobacterium sp.]
MLDRTLIDQDSQYGALATDMKMIAGSPFFWAAKRLFDIGASLLLLLTLIPAAIAILILNPFLNRGKLFFIQKRMGRDCQPFLAIK